MADEVEVAATITVHLSEAADHALDQIEILTEYSEEVIVNRAIQFYLRLEQAKAEGKAIFTAENMERLLWPND